MPLSLFTSGVPGALRTFQSLKFGFAKSSSLQSLLKSLRITSRFRLERITIFLMKKKISKNHDHFFKICHANFFDVTGTRAPKVLRALYYLENCHMHFFAVIGSFPKNATGCSKNVTRKKNNTNCM